jgi:hypothetical protein
MAPPLGMGSTLLAPATCAMFRELTEALADLRAAMEAPLLRDEAALLQRLLYKNKNQHRTTLHYRRLAEVARRLRQVLPDDATGATVGRPPPLCAPMRDFEDALTKALPPSAASAPAGDAAGRSALRGLARTMPKPIRLPCRTEGRRCVCLPVCVCVCVCVCVLAYARPCVRVLRCCFSRSFPQTNRLVRLAGPGCSRS